MADPTRIYIHAGAHRTGTSSFQQCLDINRARLSEAGFDAAYPGRDGIAGGTLALRMPHPRHRKSPDADWVGKVRAEIARHVTAPGRALILSEENIPGRMFHFYQGQFFPVAQRRAQVLAQGLPGPIEHLVYVTRSYDQLFTSAYRKRAEDNPVAPFYEIAAKMAAMDRGWPELVSIFQTWLKPKKFTIIEYGARGQSRDLLNRLLPDGAIPELEEPERQLNLSASDAALFALQDKYRAGEKLERGAWQAIIADHAVAGPKDAPETAEPFAAFSDDQTAILQQKYADDLDRIRAMNDITFIG